MPESLLRRAQLLMQAVGGDEQRVKSALECITEAVTKLGGEAGECFVCGCAELFLISVRNTYYLFVSGL